MEYSVVEGKKSNSVNYISEGYRYVKCHENNGTIYLRCTLAKQKGCYTDLPKVFVQTLISNHISSQITIYHSKYIPNEVSIRYSYKLISQK